MDDKMKRSKAKRANTPRARAREHFWKTCPELMKKLAKQGTVVLHHTDVTLKHRDKARYDKWLPEDLVPMDKRAHASLHNKRKHAKLHNIRIARSLLKAKEARAGKLVLAVSPEGDTQVFLNAAQAALWLGVSRQWANYCLRNGNCAHGWAVKLASAAGASGDGDSV